MRLWPERDRYTVTRTIRRFLPFDASFVKFAQCWTLTPPHYHAIRVVWLVLLASFIQVGLLLICETLLDQLFMAQGQIDIHIRVKVLPCGYFRVRTADVRRLLLRIVRMVLVLVVKRAKRSVSHRLILRLTTVTLTALSA